MGAELFRADGRIDTTKPIMAFRNFANALKNSSSILRLAYSQKVGKEAGSTDKSL